MSSIAVIGSVNLDIVATVARLPQPGETVTGAELAKYPGGKGANQALAAKRLGADVSLIACAGVDAAADEALSLLREGGVDLTRCRFVEGVTTGTALIAVAPSGENHIVVAPGANRSLTEDDAESVKADDIVASLKKTNFKDHPTLGGPIQFAENGDNKNAMTGLLQVQPDPDPLKRVKVVLPKQFAQSQEITFPWPQLWER